MICIGTAKELPKADGLSDAVRAIPIEYMDDISYAPDSNGIGNFADEIRIRNVS